MKTRREKSSQESELIKTLMRIFVALFVVILFIASLEFLGYIPSSEFFGFLTGLLAGIFGILIGFLLDRVSEIDKDNQTKTAFLKHIHEELSDIRKLPATDTSRIYILYTDIWDSMVSSGILSLLEPDQVIKLSKLYKLIKGTSFEAEWFRRVWDEYQSIPESEYDKKNNYVGKKLNDLGKNQLDRLKTIHREIDAVFKEDWWGTRSRINP